MKNQKNEKLFEAIGLIDDKKIMEAEAFALKGKVRAISRRAVAAAIAAVFILTISVTAIATSENIRTGISQYFGIFFSGDPVGPDPILNDAEVIIGETKEFDKLRITLESAYADYTSIAALFTLETIDGSPICGHCELAELNPADACINMQANWMFDSGTDMYGGSGAEPRILRVDDYSDPSRAQIYINTCFPYDMRIPIAGQAVTARIYYVNYSRQHYDENGSMDGSEPVILAGDEWWLVPWDEQRYVDFEFTFSDILAGKAYNTEIMREKYDVRVTPIGVYLYCEGKSPFTGKFYGYEDNSFELELLDGSLIPGKYFTYGMQYGSKDGVDTAVDENDYWYNSEVFFDLFSVVNPGEAAALIIDGRRYALVGEGEPVIPDDYTPGPKEVTALTPELKERLESAYVINLPESATFIKAVYHPYMWELPRLQVWFDVPAEDFESIFIEEHPWEKWYLPDNSFAGFKVAGAKTVWNNPYHGEMHYSAPENGMIRVYLQGSKNIGISNL